MEARNKGRGRTWAWVAGILVFLVIALYAGWQFFKKDMANPNSKVAKPLVTDQLKKMITEASDSLYHIQYDRFELDINHGKGLITNFRLIPDSAVYKRLVAANKAPNNVMHVRVDSLIINNFGFAKTPQGRRFNIAGIVIKHPVIRVVNKRMAYNDTTSGKASLLVKMMKDLLKITSVQKIWISNMVFTAVNQNGEQEKTTELQHLGILVENFNAANESIDKNDTSKKALVMKVNLCRIATRDSLYHLNFRDIVFSPDKKSMSVNKFSMVPRLSKPMFYKAAKFDKDRFHLVYNDMLMTNIDIDRFLHRQQIHVGKITTGSSWGEVMNDYGWPRRRPPLRPHGYPHELLQKLAFDVTIDTMNMHKGVFRYVIAANKSQEDAALFVTNVEGHFTNITNNTEAKKRNPYAVGIMDSKVMGAGNMHMVYKFDLASKSGAFTCSAKMGPMDGRALNPLAKPLAMIAVNSANVKGMDMYIAADEQQAKGNINFYYTDMKVNMLKRDDKADTLKKKSVLSFFANAFLPNDNPKKNGKFRKGPINVTREPRESFFGLQWKCMLDGMSSAVMGIDQHKEKPNENIAVKVLKNAIKPHKGEVVKKGQ